MRLYIGGSAPAPGNSAGANLLEWAAVLNEHEQIALACARNDVAAARQLLEHHIMEHGGKLVQRLRDQQGAPAAQG